MHKLLTLEKRQSQGSRTQRKDPEPIQGRISEERGVS